MLQTHVKHTFNRFKLNFDSIDLTFFYFQILKLGNQRNAIFSMSFFDFWMMNDKILSGLRIQKKKQWMNTSNL